MRIIFCIILSFFLLGHSTKAQEVNGSSENRRYEKWVEDINYFESEFLKKAKTYTPDSRESCSLILSSLKKQINELSDFQIRLELSRCVVLADNGHTTMSLGKTDKIPLKFYRFSDGVYVVRADSLSSQYLGAKVLAINKIDVDKVEASLFPYISGIEEWKKFKTIHLITSPKVLQELGVIKQDSLVLTLAKNGETFDATFGAVKIEKDSPWYEGWANFLPAAHNEKKWKFSKKDKSNLPQYLKDAEKGVFYSFDDTKKLAYFQINGYWEKCPNFKEKINNFHQALKTKRDFDVVIDLRFYTGGNYGLPVKLATKPPKIINDDRKIYLITSDKTYSAGIVTAARIKYYAKDKIVIVGEEVGDRLKFWAESGVCILPHSGTTIYDPQKEHDWKENKRSISRTHFANYLYGVAAKDLQVDQLIGLSFEDYENDIDPVLNWIINESSSRR